MRPIVEQAKNEILQAEKDFAALSQREGMLAAFLAFSAEDAVLNRRDQIIQGHEAIQSYFEESTLQEVHLEWTPDFVDASGQPIKAEGIFHTVWKKQADGRWRFVYD